MVDELLTHETVAYALYFAGVAAIMNFARVYHAKKDAAPGEEVHWDPERAAPILGFGALAGIITYYVGGGIDPEATAALAVALAAAANELYEAWRSTSESMTAARDRGASPQELAMAGAAAAMGHVDRIDRSIDGVKREVDGIGRGDTASQVDGPPPEPAPTNGQDAVDDGDGDEFETIVDYSDEDLRLLGGMDTLDDQGERDEQHTNTPADESR